MADERSPQNEANATRAGRPFSLLKRLLLGAAVLVVVPAVAVFFWAWTGGEVFNIGGIAHNRPAPLSGPAAFDAMIFAYLFALFVGLPLFALWSIAYGIVALRNRANIRK